MRRPHIFLSLLLLHYFHLCVGIYTNEPPVKLLEVESLADRYPASESEYRTSLTDGFVSTLNVKCLTKIIHSYDNASTGCPVKLSTPLLDL